MLWLVCSCISHSALAHPGSCTTLEVSSVSAQLSRVQLFATSWIAAGQASSPFTISQSLLKLMSIESLMSSNNLILYHPLLFLPSIFPSIRVFSNESALHIRWQKYWSFSISPSICHEVTGPDAMILVFWMLSFKPTCSLFSFTFIKRLFL